jgi:hypothetical protein
MESKDPSMPTEVLKTMVGPAARSVLPVTEVPVQASSSTAALKRLRRYRSIAAFIDGPGAAFMTYGRQGGSKGSMISREDGYIPIDPDDRDRCLSRRGHRRNIQQHNVFRTLGDVEQR